MKKILLPLIIIILIALFVFISTRIPNTGSGLVDTVRLEKRDITNYINANGRVESVQEITIYSRENCLIDKILVKEGNAVAVGEELIKIDMTERQDAVEKARLKLEQAKIAVNASKNKLDASEITYTEQEELETNKAAKYSNYQNALIEKEAAKRELEIVRELYEIGTESLQNLNTKEDNLKMADVRLSLAEKELDEASRLFEKKEKTHINFLALKTDYKNAQKQMAIARAELDLAISLLDALKVISSMAGIVTKVFVKEHEFILAGEKILSIADLERLQVRAEVDELDAPEIRKGQEVMIIFEAFDEKIFYGHVEEISPKASIEENSTIVEAIILIDQKTDILKIANQVEVKIIIDEKRGVPSLPLTAVYPGNPDYVLVYKDGIARRAEVVSGISDIDFIEIIDGLKEEENIIVGRWDNIKDGDRVRIK